MMRAILIFLLLCGSALAAEAPTLGELEARLSAVQAKREKLLSDYRLGELMMKAALLEDGPLKVQEEQFKKQLEQVKKTQ